MRYTSGQQINFCEQLAGQVTNWQITFKVLEKQKGRQTNKDNLTFQKTWWKWNQDILYIVSYFDKTSSEYIFRIH